MPFRFLISLFTLVILSLPFSALALEASIAAVVNGEVITTYDLNQRTKAVLAEQNISQNDLSQNANIKQIYLNTLDEMIKEEILLQAAAADGIRVSNAMVDSEIAARVEGLGISRDVYFQEMLSRYGLDSDAVKADVRNKITLSQLMSSNVTSKVAVTNEEVMAYYNEHKDSFGTKHTYHFALIIYPDEKSANDYSLQLLDGSQGSENFEAIAKQVSIGPNSESGGDMGALEDADIAPNLLYELQSMQSNEVSRIIDLAESKAQVKLYEKVQLGGDGTIDEETHNGIVEILTGPRIQTRYDEYIAQLNKKALIDVRYK